MPFVRLDRLPSAWLLLVLVVTAGASAGQPSSGRTLLTRVVDGHGRTQVDLGVDDFVISEGGEDREVLDVHVADYPVAVLIDDSLVPADLQTIKTAVARFVSRIGERPVAVGRLSDPERPVASFSTARPLVLAGVADVVRRQPPPQPMPSVAMLARLIRDTDAPFSAIVVVAGSPFDASGHVDGGLLPAILDSGAAVHVVEYRETEVSRQLETADLLKVLSDQTHGQYTVIYSTASFAIALDRLAERLSTELMVDYLVPPGGAAGDVRVGVRRPGARVLGLGVK